MDPLLLAALLLWPIFATAHTGYHGSKSEAQVALDAHNKVRKSAKAVAMNKLVLF